jgi:hypothetical protein
MAFSPNGQAADLVFLFEAEVCRRIDTATWTQAVAPNTDCWWVAQPEGTPSKVEEESVALTSRATLILCQANAGSYFYDPATGRLYVHLTLGGEPIDGDPYLGTFHWRRYATHDGIIYDGHPYRPVLDPSSIPDIGQSIGMYHEGAMQTSFGAIKLLNGDGHFDALLDLYIWEAKAFVVRVGEKDKGDANYLTIHNGWTGDIEWTEESISVNTEDLMSAVK